MKGRKEGTWKNARVKQQQPTTMGNGAGAEIAPPAHTQKELLAAVKRGKKTHNKNTENVSAMMKTIRECVFRDGAINARKSMGGSRRRRTMGEKEAEEEKPNCGGEILPLNAMHNSMNRNFFRCWIGMNRATENGGGK